MKNKTFDPDRLVGTETKKSYSQLIENGFMQMYLSGDNILEIGHTGGNGAMTITDSAIGIDVGYPGYDGLHLPFDSASQDAVYSSHCLEHVPDPQAALAEWFRVLKIGGYLITVVPHQLLYEKKLSMPSQFSNQHLRFYTPGRLIYELETSLPIGEWRLRMMYDNDDNFDYSLPAWQHSAGSYEIVSVVERIARAPYIDQMLRT